MTIYKIAVLLTCHNRREITLASLKALYQVVLPGDFSIEVFLVDDGSTDGTAEAVKHNFPKVHVVHGDGSLFWNQGMRLAWNTATEKADYDYYLWLNDDTLLKRGALIELFECNDEIIVKGEGPAIITGACQSSAESSEFSYGGRTDKGPVLPNGSLQECKYINGNIVLVPRAVYEKVGVLSPDYQHQFGDIDYGLRSKQAGFKSYTTKTYLAVCPTNTAISPCHNPKIPLLKRLRLMSSPKGLNMKEYIIYRKRFWGWRWIIYVLKAYLKTIIPALYIRFKSR